MKKLKLKNYLFISGVGVDSLQEFLARQQLHGKESRYRTRFLKLINDRVQEIGKEKEKIVKDYAKKDKDGNIVKKKEKGKEMIQFEDEEKAEKEWESYLDEEYTIEVKSPNKDTIYGVRDLLLDTIGEREEFSGPMAARYNEICEAFENIK